MKGPGLGEREIIRRLTGRLCQSKRKLPLGFEDDIAAVPISPRKWLVLKADSLVGSTDVPPRMTLEQASRKAVVATISDFAAKGVQPAGLLISLSLIPPILSGMVKDLARGISSAAREYRTVVVGGDTGESKDLVIGCLGFGFTKPRTLMRRDGAKPGDIIAVTGTFGKAAAGLRILLSKRESLIARFPSLVNSVLHPVARLETGLRLARTGAVNSSIDSSDGLAWSLHEIARLSKVRMVLQKIPLAHDAEIYAKEQGLDSEKLALYAGEEYELVLTVKRTHFAALNKTIPSLIKIGTVESGAGEVQLRTNGGVKKVEAQGWEHLVSRNL